MAYSCLIQQSIQVRPSQFGHFVLHNSAAATAICCWILVHFSQTTISLTCPNNQILPWVNSILFQPWKGKKLACGLFTQEAYCPRRVRDTISGGKETRRLYRKSPTKYKKSYVERQGSPSCLLLLVRLTPEPGFVSLSMYDKNRKWSAYFQDLVFTKQRTFSLESTIYKFPIKKVSNFLSASMIIVQE